MSSPKKIETKIKKFSDISLNDLLTDLSLHPLLCRQIERLGDLPCHDLLKGILQAVDTTYHESDRERRLLEHTMTAMSNELMEANADLIKNTLEIQENQQRYELAANAVNDGLWDLDCESGLVYVSARFKENLGIPADKPISELWDWFKLIHPDHKKNVEHIFENHIFGTLDRIEVEYQAKCGHEYKWFKTRGLAQRHKSGKALRVAGSLTDISQQKAYEDELKRAAFHDGLTSLPNRALFLNRLEQVIKREKRLGENPAAVIFVDLDKFKHINDTLGHEYGDAVLIHTSKVIKNNIRSCDTVARLGGDEFTILLDPVNDLDDALLTAKRILGKLNRTYTIKNKDIFIGCSMGLTLLDHHNADPETILRNADLAMYHAKSAKKGSIEVFDSGQHQKLIEKMEIEAELRTIYDRDELEIYYQPIVDLQTGKISSFEALLRWFHPIKGFISPAHFIPVAEESGLIGDIGEFVIRQAIKDIRQWIDKFGFKKCPHVGINLSTLQIVDTTSFKNLQKLFKDNADICQMIRIEVTETAVMSNPEKVQKNLQKLRNMGMKICIDDFGTGYSSLSYLHNFTYDVLKIDREFVTMINVDPKLERLVMNIIRLSKDLGLETVAEGIETEEQMEKLASLGCQKGQGFLFAKAMDFRTVSQIIKTAKQYPVCNQKPSFFPQKGWLLSKLGSQQT